MANEHLKSEMKALKVTQWQVADKLGVHEQTLCRELRHNLTKEREAELLHIIKELAEDKE